jgi:uncharacterized protein (TIGR02597 family)
MKNTALGSRSIALALTLFSVLPSAVQAVDAYTDPVGYYTLTIKGSSDNVMSLPMVKDAVFAGTVGTVTNGTSFTVLAGQAAPSWTANQFVYSAPAQRLTYYVEFTSGAFRGSYYKIQSNGAGSLTLDTEGDQLNVAPNIPGNTAGDASGALAPGDSFKIRPYWRVVDIFESNGQPVIAGRPNALTFTDDILIPNYVSVGTNKAPTLTIYYLNGTGWRGQNQGTTDYSDHIFRPNESFILRRRTASDLALTNLGGVLMTRAVSFIPGGDANTPNDIYFSISRPAPVSLDDSGLRTADQNTSPIKDSPNALSRQDELLAFDDNAGYNRAPVATYFYLAGQGWRQLNNSSTTIGADVLLQPGKSYIIRKKMGNLGRDWVNDPNY